MCRRGRDLLYAFADTRGVPYRRLGKMIFAANKEQVAALNTIRARAIAADTHDLEMLDSRQVARIEPHLACHAGLLSPSTGIVDAHAYMTALLGEAEAEGAMLVTRTEVTAAAPHAEGWAIHVAGTAGPAVVTPLLVNAAGLGAQGIAARIAGLDSGHVPPLAYAKGVYFAYSGRHPFSRLIYPIPEPGGLGVHLTLDLAGAARFGPDVEWVDGIDYAVPTARHARFAAAAQRIWPHLDPDRLHPAYAGIRPKLGGPAEPSADFVVSGPADHGCAGLVNLFGIESPGLTASLALAEYVGALLDG